MKLDLLPGTLDLLILQILSLEPTHGLGVARRLQDFSEQVLQVPQGSLYPALKRLEAKGWVESDWGLSENNRRAKYFSLTAAGEAWRVHQVERWYRLSRAVSQTLAATEVPGSRRSLPTGDSWEPQE